MTQQPTGRIIYGEVPRFGQHQPPTYGPPPPPQVPHEGRAPIDGRTAWGHPFAHGLGTQPAGWGRRTAAHLIDVAPNLVAYGVFLVGYGMFVVRLLAGDASAWTRIEASLMLTGAGLAVPALVWQAINRWRRAGRTGQSVGKRALGIRLLSAQTGQPIGGGNAFLRDLVHLLDALSGLGYLWPLWDRHRQTLADKLMRTTVTVDRAAE